MICSSVNLIRFIRPSLLKGQTLNLRGGNTQWQVTGKRQFDFAPEELSRKRQLLDDLLRQLKSLAPLP
jgi:hypothetical protein